jgi:hypothetical protein
LNNDLAATQQHGGPSTAQFLEHGRDLLRHAGLFDFGLIGLGTDFLQFAF